MTESAQTIIDRFQKSAADYAEDVVRRANAEVEAFGGDISADDFQQILLGLPTVSHNLFYAAGRAKKEIENLKGNGGRREAWEAFANAKTLVRRQMEAAYGKAVEIVESAAIQYVVAQHKFASDVDKLPKEFRDEVFRKAWTATLKLKRAKLSDVMDAFHDVLDVVDCAWRRHK